jgi:hypothetical protein
VDTETLVNKIFKSKKMKNLLSVQKGEFCDYLLCNGVIIGHINDNVTKAQVASKGINFEREQNYKWGIEKEATLENGDKYFVLEAENGYQEAAFINPTPSDLTMFVYRILE